MTFFRHLLSPEKCFSTQNFPNLHQIFSDDLFIVGLIYRHFKEKFPPKFSKGPFSLFLPKENFLSTQFLEKMFWSTRLVCIDTVSREKVPVGYSVIFHNYDIVILTNNIIHSSLSFPGTPVRRTGAYYHKKP